jgi:hypothetical protein
MRALDLNGMKFGRLTVLNKIPNEKGKSCRWLCECDCGTLKDYGASFLSRGARSCGCQHWEETRTRLTTHGMTNTKLFRVWNSMLRRCRTPGDTAYKNYGGRGIEVCDRRNSFENFYADMGPTYGPGLTIERVNNDGDYSPDNCVWIPKSLQSRNRRSAIYIETPWGRLTITEAAAKTGISWFAMMARVNRKWAPERMFLGKQGKGGRVKKCVSLSLEAPTKQGA